MYACNGECDILVNYHPWIFAEYLKLIYLNTSKFHRYKIDHNGITRSKNSVCHPGSVIDTCIGSKEVLLPTGSEERGVLWVGSISVTILSSCQNMKTKALYLRKHKYSWVVKIRNISEAILRPQYTPWPSY